MRTRSVTTMGSLMGPLYGCLVHGSPLADGLMLEGPTYLFVDVFHLAQSG
jgi:hypothetical protein